MARIDWALLCDVAFFDREDRLCIIGIVRRFPAPMLPLTLTQVMLVARLVEIQSIDEVAVSVIVVTPSGFSTAPANADDLVIEMAGDYVLLTLRGLPLVEEGVYRFLIGINEDEPISIDVPVLTVGPAALTATH